MTGRIRTWLGASWRLVAIVAVIAAVIALPLLAIRRDSGCRGAGERPARWSVRAPFDDDRPAECRRSETGLEALAREVGLR